MAPKNQFEDSSQSEINLENRRTRRVSGFFRYFFGDHIPHKNDSHEHTFARAEDASMGSSVDSSTKQDEYLDEDIDDRSLASALASQFLGPRKLLT